jgi:hypothetical protein
MSSKKTTVKMLILGSICAILTLCLLSCSSTADNSAGKANSNYGQINTNNGNADGGIGDAYSDTDMSLDGVAGDAAKSVNDAIDNIEGNMGINSKKAGGNTTANY